MKKTICLVVAASMLLSGCGQPRYFNNGTSMRYYPTYGIFNENSSRSKDVCYEISVGNIIWSLILVETFIFSVYFVGWSLFNPVRLKRGPNDQCTFDS